MHQSKFQYPCSSQRLVNGRSNPEVVGSIPTEVTRIFSVPRVVPGCPLLGANAQWVFHGFHLALEFTLQNEFSVLSLAVVNAANP